MANVSLDQFVHLKQPASEYLSQGYQIACQLTDLKAALEELVFAIKAFLKSGHEMLDKSLIPVSDLEALSLSQIHATEILHQAADHIASYQGFEAYSATVAQMGVTHG